ncbi:MAG: amino acid ABC transporter substrate-binding protein [Tagaea sp.]
MKAFASAIAAAAIAVTAIPVQAQQPASSPTVDAIRARGHLQCGANGNVAGFGIPNARGEWTGLDVDFCRLAAAVFGDATKVRFTALTAQQRFTALQSGEVDVLARNTTWTLSRDTSLGLEFGAINFYDGQGFIVKRSANIKSAKELNGATICVQPGTTTELNLADYFRANRMRFTPVVIERLEENIAAYLAGRCDAYTTDVSGLASIRAANTPNPADHIILPEVISKEPLGPSVRHGDQRWADIVKWVHYAMLEAEELGITQANVDSHANSTNPNIQRLLGRTGGLGAMLGLDNAWAFNIVKQVGNYGEIFEKNVTPLGIERGVNRLWTQGGLMYNPPLR